MPINVVIYIYARYSSDNQPKKQAARIKIRVF